MTKEELLKLLKESGIKPGEWKSGGGPDRKVQIPFVKEQMESLKKVRDLIKLQTEKDLAEIQRLRELQNKIKHGGSLDNG